MSHIWPTAIRTVEFQRDKGIIHEVNNVHDGRKNNRGAAQRRSYTCHSCVSLRNEEKLSVISMRDLGLSYDEIAKKTGFSRVNMEKWCSQKGRDAILTKAAKTPSMLRALPGMDPTAHTSPGPTTAAASTAGDRSRNSTLQTHYSGARLKQSTKHSAPPLPTVPTELAVGRVSDCDSSSGGEEGWADGCGHTLNLVARHQCEKAREARRRRLSLRSNNSASNSANTTADTVPQLQRKRKQGEGRSTTNATAGPAIARRAPIAAVQESQSNHSFLQSDVTMTINSSMLHNPFDSTSASSNTTSSSAGAGQGFTMSTALQATRPIVGNTKFFSVINAQRKRQQQGQRVYGGSDSEGSDQEREDSAIMGLLGE